MKILIDKNIMKLNLLLLFFNFLTPSNFSRTFTGLPITSEINLIFLFIFLPIIFFKLDLIKSKFLALIFFILTMFKIFLILAPNTGISHKMYFDKSENVDFIVHTKDNYIENCTCISSDRFIAHANSNTYNNHTQNYRQALPFGIALSLQAWNRNISYKANKENRRGHIQLKITKVGDEIINNG